MIFPDFSDNSREKQIFVNFWPSYGASLLWWTPILGKIKAFLRHFRLKCLRMPSFCPILESSIKVMHRRMAKNDQKFTKNCFCRELSLKSGKIIFYEFWIIFGHSTVHHLKKLQKIPENCTSRKKPISCFF